MKSKTKKVFIILPATKQYVAGFNERLFVVEKCTKESEAKRFDSERQARNWLRDHADAGYGLDLIDTSLLTYS